MKILHFIGSLGVGGTERRLVELLKGLGSRTSIKCELAIMSDNIFYSAVHSIDIRIHYLIRRMKKDPSIFVQLYKICKDFKPDIIHTWESMNSVYAVPVAKMLRIKLVNAMIASAPSKLKKFKKSWIRSKLTFPFSDVIVSNSYAGLRSYNAPKHKSYCIHNGFDFSRTKNLESAEEIRKRFKINTSSVVGMVAGFSNRKDYESYILAAMQVLRRRNDVTFLAIGDGNNFGKCKEEVKPEFRDKIKFLGKQNDIESIINSFDIGVLATNQRVHGEGISNSILEYMAFAKPVVVTNGGGTSEIVTNNKTGFLVEAKKVGELAEKMEFLLNNKAVAKKMGSVGKERLVKEFSLEKMTDRMIEVYQDCIS